MKVQYDQVNLNTILRYWIDGYNTIKGNPKVVNFEAYVDTAKNTVVFKLITEEPNEN